jgi:hypothetical protein
LWLFCAPVHSLELAVADAAAPVQGASVLLDGAAQAPHQTDAFGRVRLLGLAAADHSITVQKRGYESAGLRVRFSDLLCLPCRNTVQLFIVQQDVLVSTVPTGAAIFLDNDERVSHGVTDRSVRLPVGPHSILLKLDGYFDSGWQQFDVAENQKAQLSIPLRRRPQKLYPVLFYSSPPGATILEGRKALGRTNGPPVMLLAGEHQIALQLPGQRVIRP